jgi:hypothetical protein
MALQIELEINIITIIDEFDEEGRLSRFKEVFQTQALNYSI